MQFEKFKDAISNQPTLREGIAEIISLFPNDHLQSFPMLPRLKATQAESRCLALLKKHKNELKDFPSQDLKDLVSKISINCQSRIFHIINCLSDTQIKELFKTPENKTDVNGGYVLGTVLPYVFSGYISSRVSSGFRDYTQLYEGYSLLRNNHSVAIANLVMKYHVLEMGIENGLFNNSGSDIRSKNIYEKRLQKITECFEANKKQIHKTYGKEIESPLDWMDAFLKKRDTPTPENYALREGIKNYAAKLKLEEVIPVIKSKKSVMKI